MKKLGIDHATNVALARTTVLSARRQFRLSRKAISALTGVPWGAVKLIEEGNVNVAAWAVEAVFRRLQRP